MVIVGEVLVTKIIEKVIDVGFSYLADQWHSGGMKDELQRLKVALPRIQAVVAAADNAWTLEQQTANPHLESWLQQFKDALYEADDTLDELEYLRLQKQVEEEDDRRDEDHNKKQVEGDTSLDERPHKVRRLLSQAKENIMCFFKSDPTPEKLRRAVKRLDEVASHVKDFREVQQFHHQQHQSRTMISRETGSLVTETNVFGRDREREELLQWLMMDRPDQDEKNNVSLYSVVGVGGMGKTTIAQLVYNDENVQKSFDLKMWVCVSTSFDVRRITAAMLESATKNKPNIDNLATLQDVLNDKLMSSNKFLLVLDDVWDDQKNCTDWDSLLAPLRHGHKGSKILLTTRMDKVAKEAARAMAGSTEQSMQLYPMHGDDFFSLFNRYAFASISSGDYKELQPLGTKIAERLGGSPLAAKTIGALLNSNLDERYWRSILNCKNISDQGQQPEGNIMSILMLSYHHLPLYLRPCFAFCSTFPQDYMFDKEDQVLKWMALGLIQHSPQNQGLILEDIGSYYFDELFNRSFFEQKKGYKSKCSYFMHDLLHDVARSVSHGECFSIVNDDKSAEDIPNTVRHLYLATDNPNIVMKVDKWQQLHSLQLRINSHVLAEVLEKVIKSLKCVRMLEVCVDGMRVLPDVFGHLRHLRSLTIREEIDEFPASLCKLHNLQVLKLTIKDSTAANLPENMKNLISLRHLVMRSSRYGGRMCPVIIARVRKLASLQVLSIFIKKERDYRIDELEGLNMIRELHLDGLENVESREEASMVKLGNKEHLRVLTLGWSGDNDDTERNNPTKMDEQQQQQQQQIVDCLQPHSSLKELTIVGYKGVRPAKWMEFELVNNLQRISLCGCLRLEHLPCFGKLPFLKYLSLWLIPLVKQLDCDCQQLEELRIYMMQGLEELSHSDGNSSDQWCPCLRKLQIHNCPKLSVLPSLSLSLKSMKIERCPNLRLDPTVIDPAGNDDNFLPSSLEEHCIKDCGESERSIPTLLKGAPTSLSSLSLGGIESLPCSSVWRRLGSLDSLTISNCEELMSLEVISALQHLRCLTIRGCPKLVSSATTTVATGSTLLAVDELFIDDPMLLLTDSLIRNLTSIRQLCIWNCRGLESISGEMEEWLLQRRTTLNILSLHNASSLKSLPDSLHTFSSLEYLALYDAGELQSVPRLPSSVRLLYIRGCNHTLKDRCRKDEGADWPNINHIPHITISNRK